MKKILIWLSVLALLILTACGENQEPPTTAQLPHTHNYASQEIPATCIEKGTKTFTCTCGDTYTEEIAATGEHSWGDWERKAYAFIDKVGSEERVCKNCSATETRERTENAVANSFQDGGLQYVIWSGGNLNVYAMYPYACHEFHDYIEEPNVPAENVFDLLAQCFNLTEDMKNNIKTVFKASAQGEYGYDAATDTFYLPYNAESGNFSFLGYKHNGGNQYTTYYSYSEFGVEETEEFYWAFELEYNRSNGQPNKYLSAKQIASVPSDMIPTDGWVEFEGPIAK